MKNIPIVKSSMPPFEEYIDEIKSLWETRWLTNNGEKHNNLELKLKDYLSTENLTLFTNGHMALEYIISAMNLKGDVITTPFTFASTTQAIVRSGLTPVFCDIKIDDYTIDPEKIERLITDKTCAILPVHVYGNICDNDAIEKVAKKYNIPVIYDAAHAFGTKVNGVSVANFGDASMFSFHATKVFHTIEGGALTYSDESLKKKLDALKNFGLTSPETVDYIGGNGKMSEFQASMGLCNLKYVDSYISSRKIIYDRYYTNLKDIKSLKVIQIPDHVESNYAYFSILFIDNVTRDRIFTLLGENSVTARKYFYPMTSIFECYENKYNDNNTPIAKRVSESILTLPIFPELSIEDVDFICKTIISEVRL